MTTLDIDAYREHQVAEMAKAGQALAVKWGHPPWSDSWAELVAGTMLGAALRAATEPVGASSREQRSDG